MNTVLHLATSLTEDYLDRGRPFLRSLARVRQARCWCVCYGWTPTPGLRRDVPHLSFGTMPRHASESFGMIQHGRWLDALPDIESGAVAILSDADGEFQRDLAASEVRRLLAYDDETFGAGWNSGPDDDLIAEGERIGLRDHKVFPGEAPLYNCGLLVMRTPLWRRLQDLYESRCEEFYGLSNHRSRCQWLVCWCLSQIGAKIDLLGREIHTQSHFGVPEGVSFGGDLLYHQGTPILFRHRL